MKSPVQEKSAPAPSKKSVKPIQPNLPPPTKAPETVEELYHALAGIVEATIHQPDPEGERSPQKQDYALPWSGFESWRDARKRLAHFETAFNGKLVWAPFNDSESNDGPMSLNAYPGRAFIERVTNEGDAVLEAKAASHKGAMPSSPAEAAAIWFGLGPGALATGLDDAAARDLAKNTVTVRTFVGADPKDPKDCILDARDYGIGLTAEEMPGTILSLNRGLKKSKPWLTGKHGQGASSTYQYSDLTLIASRKIGTKEVAFTVVEGRWENGDTGPAKTPTYRYLTVNGRVPTVTLPESEFPPGTLVRHIGYHASDLGASQGENSLYGLLTRSLAAPVFPAWMELFYLRSGTDEGYPIFRGYRRFGRLIRGTVNTLERAWAQTLNPPAKEAPQPLSKVLHRSSEFYKLGQWDYGGRAGVGDLGSVKITYWVADPNGRTSQDVLKNWVDPEKTVLLTLDGQTHAEESRSIVTGQNGAKLWAVGRYMVVQIDCNGLDPKAKYEMFTSTREHAKDTPVKKMILEELARRLVLDKKLEELNTQFAAADVKQPQNDADTIAGLIKKYLKAAGVSFEQLTRRVEKWKEVEAEQVVPASKREPPPITANEPPTFIRWKFSGTTVKLYPGQRYSYVFETDASPVYWNPADPAESKIKVLAQGVTYRGAGEMKGGRVRCHFQCQEEAAIGAKGLIQAQLEWGPGAALTAPLPVEVVEKPQSKPKPSGEKDHKEPNESGDDSNVLKVKIKKRDFTELEIPVVTPVPVTTKDPAWLTLAWPLDPQYVGFSIRAMQGKIQLYYNAEFPPFLELRRKVSKRRLEDAFVKRYELKLILHTIFTLNYDFVDEEEFLEDQRKKVRNLLCAVAESLALASKSELEIESRLKIEEAGANLAVAAELAAAVTAASSAGTASSPGEPAPN